MSKSEANKTVFVERDLAELIRTANDQFCSCEYKMKGADEFVIIKTRSGCTYTIDVTADTYLGIVYDVVRYLKNL